MKFWVNLCIGLFALACIMVIVYVKLGIGYPVWYPSQFESINSILLNLSYSYLAGVIVYLLTIVLPDFWQQYKLKPIIDERIKYIGLLFEKQMVGFGSDDVFSPDCTKIDECIQVMQAADWNAINATRNPFTNRKRLFITYKEDLDLIFSEISSLLVTYQKQLSTKEIQYLESFRQDDFIILLNSLYDFNAIITAEGRKDCVEGHKRLLQKYNSILQLRGIELRCESTSKETSNG